MPRHARRASGSSSRRVRGSLSGSWPELSSARPLRRRSRGETDKRPAMCAVIGNRSGESAAVQCEPVIGSSKATPPPPPPQGLMSHNGHRFMSEPHCDRNTEPQMLMDQRERGGVTGLPGDLGDSGLSPSPPGETYASSLSVAA